MAHNAGCSNAEMLEKIVAHMKDCVPLNDMEKDKVLFGKLNAASSVTLKQVFYSALQRYQSHSFGCFRHVIL